jgi:hypothetical protein
MAGIPPALKATPTSIKQMIWSPPARVPNIFTSSFQSGDQSQGQVIGTGIIALPIIIDYTMGNPANLPILFPPNSFLYAVSIQCLVPFTAVSVPTVTLGRTTGGAEILSAQTMSKVLHSVTNTPVLSSLPFPGDTGLGLVPWQALLTVAGNDAGLNTAGSNLMVILYGRQ